MSITATELTQAVKIALIGLKRVVILSSDATEDHALDALRRAKIRNKSAAWRAANKQRSQAYAKEWRTNNRPRVKAADRKWRERNRETYLAMRRAANRRYYLKNQLQHRERVEA